MNEKNAKTTSRFRPVFVVGNSRSGTTMMGRIIGLAEEIYTFHELHFFEQLWSPVNDSLPLSRLEGKKLCAQVLSIERDGYLSKRQHAKYIGEAETLLSKLEDKKLRAYDIFKETILYEAMRHGKHIPCDQTPRNVFYIAEILNIFPGSRIINMVRDPRDVLLSQKNKWRRRSLGANNIPLREAFRARINYHPITISKLWHSSISASAPYRSNSNVMTVIFEKLIEKPVETVKKVCNFIDIPYKKDLLEIPQAGSSHRSDLSENTGIFTQVTKRWRTQKGLSPCDIYWCQKINGKLMKRFGYELEPVSPGLFPIIFNILIFPFQFSLAMLLNIKRMKNVVSAVKKRI